MGVMMMRSRLLRVSGVSKPIAETKQAVYRKTVITVLSEVRK